MRLRTRLEVVPAPPTELGEGPMWSVAEQVLYWIDIVQRRILRMSPATGRVDVRELPYAPSAVIPRAAGGLLLVTKKGLATLQFDDRQLVSVPVSLVDFKQEVFNDAKCDRAGRLWVGTRDLHVRQPVGGLFRLDPGFGMQRHREALVVSNGIAFADEGRRMYHVDSHPGRIDVFDVDAATGTLANGRVFRDYATDGSEGFPDGCTTDADGGLWVAEVGRGLIRRYTPEGRCEREILLPVTKPTSVMFGGPGLQTLYVTSMRFGLSQAQLAEQPLAGALFQIDVGFRGLAEPVFAG